MCPAIYHQRLSDVQIFYQKEYEEGKISNLIYEDKKLEIQTEIDEIASIRRHMISGEDTGH